MVCLELCIEVGIVGGGLLPCCLHLSFCLQDCCQHLEDCFVVGCLVFVQMGILFNLLALLVKI